MADERDILRNRPFSLDGAVLSLGTHNHEIKVGRERLPWRCYEEPGQFSDKGDWTAEISFKGYGNQSHEKLLERLAQDSEDDTSYLIFQRGNTQASPFALPGDPASFFTVRTFNVSTDSAEAGKLREYGSEHSNSDGSRPYLTAQVIYTNRAKVPAPLGAGVVTPDEVTLGALAAGMLAVFTVHVTKITGTGVVKVLAEIMSDTPGFTTPLVRGTFLLFSNEDPPTGTDVLGPKSQTLVLDGDTAAFPGETDWTIRFTVTDTASDAQVEIMAAGVVVPK